MKALECGCESHNPIHHQDGCHHCGADAEMACKVGCPVDVAWFREQREEIPDRILKDLYPQYFTEYAAEFPEYMTEASEA